MMVKCSFQIENALFTNTEMTKKSHSSDFIIVKTLINDITFERHATDVTRPTAHFSLEQQWKSYYSMNHYKIHKYGLNNMF